MSAQNQVIQSGSAPVPVEEHYTIFKCAEDKITDHLAEFEHEYFVIGLRVAYDFKDSSSEPGVLPYTMEFGSLGPLDAALKCNAQEEEGTDEELSEATKGAPISIELLDRLYDYAKEALQSAATEELRVGVFVMIHGSSSSGGSVSCGCSSGKKQYCVYNKKIKQYITKCKNAC